SRDQRQRRRRGIARPEMDQRRTGEIAVNGVPGPALPALATLLLQRDEPIALDRQLIGQQGAVGRTEPVDDSNTHAPTRFAPSEVEGPVPRLRSARTGIGSRAVASEQASS